LGPLRRSVRFTAGRNLRQFNPLGPITPFYNSLYTLFTGDNFAKLFEQEHISIEADVEPANGLRLKVNTEWARRYRLENLSRFEDRRDYTPNNPDPDFTDHTAFTLGVELSYRFNQQFRIARGKRRDVPQNNPRVYLGYRGGFNMLGGETRFDYVDVGYAQGWDWGYAGLTRFDFSMGTYMTSEKLTFADFKHFNGIQNLFLQPVQDPMSDLRQFSVLAYYSNSTGTQFLEVHVQHDFRRPFWNSIWKDFGNNWSTQVGANFLYTREESSYLELYAGVSNIFEIGSVQLVLPFPRSPDLRTGIRVGIELDYSYYRTYHRN
jgi:hypothetical protein